MTIILLLNLFWSFVVGSAHQSVRVSTTLLAAPQPAWAGAPRCSNPYIVRAGDTLASIAQRCGVTVTNLMRWNGLRFARVFVGQRLTVRAWQTPFVAPAPPTISPTQPKPAPTPRITPPIQP
jgi:LysM repeat protein